MAGRVDIVLPPALTAAALEPALEALSRPATLYVLRGSEAGVFCRGLALELAANEPEAAVTCVNRLAQLVMLLSRTPAPVVALVDGEAFGGGAALAAAADLVLATPASSFSLPEAVMGLIPAVALPVVAARTTVTKARLLALSAKPWSAEDARAHGLVDAVASNLEPRLLDWEKRWGRLDAEALASIKKWANAQLDLEAQLVDAVSRFEAQLRRPETAARLKKWAGGDAPWS
jgi:enoyl-CoA hydratase/carnithine racemase